MRKRVCGKLRSERSVRGPALSTAAGSPAPAPARALTRRGAKDGRLDAAQHVGDALGEVVREGTLLEGRNAVGDHMPYPRQVPKRTAHGGGGACRTEGRQAPGSCPGRSTPTPTGPPRRPRPPQPRRRPHPPRGRQDRGPVPYSGTGVTSPSTVAGCTGLRPPLPVGSEAALGGREVTSGRHHFPAVSGEGAVDPRSGEKCPGRMTLCVGGAWARGRGSPLKTGTEGFLPVPYRSPPLACFSVEPPEAAGYSGDKEATRKGPADLEGRAGRALSTCEASNSGERPRGPSRCRRTAANVAFYTVMCSS